MNIEFREYKDSDFDHFRTFLVENYESKQGRGNWKIDRLNFCSNFVVPFKNLTNIDWNRNTALWELDNKIIAIANCECEERGESFFQLSDSNIPVNIYEEMFDFIEKNHKREVNNKNIIQLRIPENYETLEEIAHKRGFIKTDWSEKESVMNISKKLEYSLAKNFRIVTGDKKTAYDKALAHYKAFSQIDSEPIDCEEVKIREKGFAGLTNAVDYFSDQEILILDENDEVSSFCTIWFDEVNKLAVLEPVGTIKKYHKMGLAKSAIYEAINRVYEKGARKIYVGSDMDFYKKIGFELNQVNHIWEKTY